MLFYLILSLVESLIGFLRGFLKGVLRGLFKMVFLKRFLVGSGRRKRKELYGLKEMLNKASYIVASKEFKEASNVDSCS